MVKVDNIWIVDDDDIYTRLLKKSIAKLNLANSVTAYQNGKVALDSLQEQINCGGVIPDLIFLDINMPVVDGWAFMEEYAEFPQQTLNKTDIYIVSSSIASDDRQKALRYKEVKDYIVKPIDTVTLVKIVESHGPGMAPVALA